jgi:transcriptional regulator with XRE-family HTH domain
MSGELPVLVQADDVARRVRAARAYAGLSVRELADAIGIGLQTIKRIEAGSRAPRTMEVWAIAEVCGLPREWFEVDFDDLARHAAAAGELLARVDARLARLEAQLGISSRNGHGAG